MLYILILSNKFDLKQTIRVLHIIDAVRGVIYDRHMFIVQATDDLRQASRRNIIEDTTLDATVANMANAFVY